MRSTTRRLARTSGFIGSLLGTAALAVACSLQSDRTGPNATARLVSANQTSLQSPRSRLTVYYDSLRRPMPDSLRWAGDSARAIARFVVDTNGHPIVTTIQIIELTDRGLIPGVRAMIPTLRFLPTYVDGKKVERTVEFPFVFHRK